MLTQKFTFLCLRLDTLKTRRDELKTNAEDISEIDLQIKNLEAQLVAESAKTAHAPEAATLTPKSKQVVSLNDEWSLGQQSLEEVCWDLDFEVFTVIVISLLSSDSLKSPKTTRRGSD